MTREEAIEIVQAVKFIDDFDDYSDRLEIALDMAIEALKERPQWIPCSEGLPEEGKSVLVWYEYYAYGNKNRMVQTYGVGRVYGDFWAGDVQGTRSKCIAWMPLPEPYKEEGEKE